MQKCTSNAEAIANMIRGLDENANQSIENMMLLLCLKATFPDDVHLLRGNHECASINRIYGFYDECKRRYNVRLWKTFADMLHELQHPELKLIYH